MRLYDALMYPMEKRTLMTLRKKLMPQATGDVLEVGAGTGVNLGYYKPGNMASLTLVDVGEKTVNPSKGNLTYTFVRADVTALPFADSSFDTVVATLLLCSVDDEPTMLAEIARVLKPNGRYIHIDHGLPHGKFGQGWFRCLAPIWRGITQSCRIDKDQRQLISDAGFVSKDAGYSKHGVFYWGVSTFKP